MKFKRALFQQTVGSIIKDRREQEGMTQEQIAHVLDMKRPTYANLECGRNRIPSDVIWRLAVYYGVSVQSLLPDPEPTKIQSRISTYGATGTTGLLLSCGPNWWREGTITQ